MIKKQKKKARNNQIGLSNNISLYSFQFFFYENCKMKSKRKKKKYEWLNHVIHIHDTKLYTFSHVL